LETHTPQAPIPAAAIVGAVIVLRMVLIIMGFDPAPLMAITIWSRAAWIAILVVIFIAAALGVSRLRSSTRI